MYLKSLELQGFKSFPDRTTIRFSDGMTAIVGPNGSGKSNISDAIRWVLGEQSTKSLRGAKMEDVVFAGTARRSPMGAAQVTLILDNSAGQFPVEATEVMVTRKYYRSGESEYYLNRKRVRLRDVREVFMDTGLGHDGYSIIGQGRIDEILAVKSADRREVFEEAAGVTRFRTRKEEAERKLEQTADNLVRIRDIWNELNARSGPLAKQAEDAKKYIGLRDELRVHEVSLWMDTLDGMKDARDTSERERREAEQKLEAVREAQRKQYMRAEQLAEEMRQSDIRAEQLQAQLSAAEEAAAGVTRRMAVLDESRRNAAENIGLAKGQLEAQREQTDALRGQMQARQTRLEELEQQIAEQSAALEQKQKAVAALSAQVEDSQKQADRLREQAEELGERMFAVQADRRAAEARLEALEGRSKSVGDDVRSAKTRTEREQEAQQEMQHALDEMRGKIAQEERALQRAQEDAQEAARMVNDARREHAELTAALTDSRNRVRMLTELQREYEGFSRAVKLVMGQASSGALKGVRGPLSSLIHVSGQYVTAIETALGAAASNLVVETAQHGKLAIQMLKKRDGGRATFLPMDTIRPQSLRESGLEQNKGFCGVAADLVDCDADYRDIVDNALGRTVVAQDMDCALAIARSYRNRFRIVTLDGQIINAGGSMTGGSAGRSSGILSRANQLEQMQERARVQQEKLDRLTARGKQLAEDAKQHEQDAARMGTALAEQRQKLAALSAQAKQHQILLDSVREAEQQFRAEQSDAEQHRKQLRTDIARLEQQAAELGRERQRALTALNAAAGSAQKAAGELTIQNDRAAELRTALVQAQTERDSAQQGLDDLKQMAESAQRTAEDHRRRMGEYEQVIRQADAERTQLETRGEENRQRTEDLRTQLRECGQSRMRLEQNKTEAEKTARETGNDMVTLERRHAEAEAAAQQLRREEQQILDKMWESYELTPTAARPLAHVVQDRQAEEKQASDLRRAIRSLGAVNLSAVDEYAELSERLIFLTGQKNDLEQAEGELRGIIGKLTEQMKDTFAQSFAQLNQYFGETFREIFGGGSAELILEDETDILGCGIEIRVTPPGKTVKSLSLLSGGEKAFVAIALYFAILKVRPTPFCVLDEIEAALDDVNVTRFAQYLQRLSDKTQFIVITHRRGTMEEADMLYGVTMQERGVSKLLMLNIADVEREMKMELT
ncbi:chromosome segregation protein SMC [Butyricicoccus porcorum]|uniref:chromosome segregation protein SMC n=1 Tax=Butyricicoccus porcorum TaxID=1945634 RepID=UPI003F4AE00E